MQADGIVLLSALVTGIALAGALASVRTPVARASRRYLLIVFGLMTVLCALPMATAIQPAIYTFYMPALLPLMFSLPVVVHRYARSLLTDDMETGHRLRDVLLPLPGAGVMAGYWLLSSETRAALFIDGELPGGLAPAILTLLTFGLILIWVLASLAYMFATLRTLARYRANLKTLYSNIESHEVRWIDGLLILLVALWAAAATTLLNDNLALGFLTPDLLVFALAGGVLLLLIAFALAPPPPDASAPHSLAPNDEPNEKYARSALSGDRSETIAERLVEAMRDEALYLDPNLSLLKLSKHVRTPPNLVSQTLNARLSLNFFDFVARWRIEDAKSRILAGEESVLNIALGVGFNSRSTFYKAFKRETGQTPKEFRRAAHGSNSMPSSENLSQ